jgi:transcription antitermination factor NusG
MSISKQSTSNINLKHWHALYVSSRTEKKVMQSLLSKNIESYIPLVKTMRQWSDRKKMVEFPLINGYVFVNISALEIDKTLQTKGIVNFVRQSGKIAVIREVEINRLKQLVDLGYQIESDASYSELEIGYKVKITSGPLKNIEGFIINKFNDKYLFVQLESIGKSIKVKLPEDILLSIES